MTPAATIIRMLPRPDPLRKLTPSAETVSNSSRLRSSQLVWLSLRRMRVSQ